MYGLFILKDTTDHFFLAVRKKAQSGFKGAFEDKRLEALSSNNGILRSNFLAMKTSRVTTKYLK